MTFQLIIIGDEIIHGSRVDAHFSAIKTLLTERGFVCTACNTCLTTAP